jgi:protein lysine acetyltransferase
VVTTVIDVPDPRDLPLSRDISDKIKRLAHQVIRSVG